MKKIGTLLVSEPESSSRCEDCGSEEELRPYGPNRTNVCVACAQKTPHIMMGFMVEHLTNQLSGVRTIVGPEGQILNLGTVSTHEDLVKRIN